jgi:peptidoglycan hydrolase-like protein with peptidoglycan-binding domain
VQTELAGRGYYHGPIDGVIGSGSREAIRAFQRAQGLPVTGVVDPALLKALKLPPVPRVAASDRGVSTRASTLGIGHATANGGSGEEPGVAGGRRNGVWPSRMLINSQN